MRSLGYALATWLYQCQKVHVCLFAISNRIAEIVAELRVGIGHRWSPTLFDFGYVQSEELDNGGHDRGWKHAAGRSE
jgi:hypothetical protein